MLYADRYLEKYASKQKSQIEIWESTLDPQGKEERELVRKYQQAKNPYEKGMYLKQLKLKLRNVLSTYVTQSGATSTIDRDVALQLAETNLVSLLDSFDLSKPNKLTTYLQSNLPNMLKKSKDNFRDMTSRRSEALSRTNQYVRTANKFLVNELSRTPTHDEIYDFVTNRMGRKIQKDQIARNMMMDRTELNGNEIIGKGDDSSAEPLSLLDIKHIGSQSPEEILKSQQSSQKVDTVLNRFGKRERIMLRKYYGLGEYKGKSVNANKAATDAGMTYYEAKKTIDSFEKLMDEHVF